MTEAELDKQWQVVIDLYNDLVEYIQEVNADPEIMSKLVALMDIIEDYCDALDE